MITPDEKAHIRRLFYVEHQTVNAIAAALGFHHETVKRAIDAAAFQNRSVGVRRRLLDAFEPQVAEIFGRLPKIRSTRLAEILRDRGYKGSVYQVRRRLRELRRRGGTACYLRVVVFPGDQGQCDWGHFGTMTVGRAKRKLSCFVMVLSYSRRLYAAFTFDQTLESFLRCHVAAFRSFQGVPRVILYDNLKAAVIERFGRAIRFNPALLELAGHYHFRPEPCNPARGNEKGRVERAIGYLRTSFFPGRHFASLDDANRQLTQWVDTVANVRAWPQDRGRAVADAYDEERPRLLALPEHDVTPLHVGNARSDKTAYVRFDLNDYSIPHEYSRKPLTLTASDSEIRLLDVDKVVARHVRSYSKGEQIEEPAHVEGLLAMKKGALPARRREALVTLIPSAGRLVEMLIERNEAIHGHLRRLYDLVEQYGAATVAPAIDEAIERGTPRSESVAHIIHRNDKRRKDPPSLPVHLPDRPGVRDLVVKSHSLDQYDRLKSHQPEEKPL